MHDVQILDTANERNWSLQDGLRAGDNVFGDRDFKFTAVPDYLAAAEVLRTACDSKKYRGDQARFTAAEDLTVYLGVDDRLTPPDWLAAWTRTDDVLTDDGAVVVTYEVYRRDVKAGETVTVGINGDAGTVNYVIAALPYAAPAPEKPAGDVDADGARSVADAVALQRYLLMTGTLADPAAADLDGNGTVDVFDLAYLKRLLLNK